MYVWAQGQRMPLGPGLLWLAQNGRFKKQIMLTKEGASLEALQWLMWLESTISTKLGNPIVIEHAYHRGEKIFGKWKVDGYACIEGMNWFFEYHGMFI